MPVPVPDVVRAADAELVVTDLRRSRWFWVDVLGFVPIEEDDEVVYLRGYEEFLHHSLVLRQGARAGLRRLAYRVRTPQDVGRAADFFAAEGLPVQEVPAGATRGIGEAVRVEDPLGFPVEFFHAAERGPRLVQRYELRRGAEPSRIDHFNVMTPDVRAAHDFYARLGFSTSETIEDDENLYAAWMFRKPTVHDIAFTGGAGPRLHHIAFFVPESHHILRICDILGSLGEHPHIERGPGRHGVSNAFYLYLRDPDGHRLELYTSDYYTGDPDHETYRWDVHDPRRRDFWGHDVVSSWYREGSTALGLDGRPKPLVHPAASEETVHVGADGLGVVTEAQLRS
ncbi:3,4-dihydroxyphenylacetate 2,3-dioxygenase [Saccharopolyspora rosea]|uniref:3,4-dihydroxyphenylacetate 2,3-dioxygenase n=1 Tax=Saccharopolyspora rosea TaxID=524884 RepID=A0ABW3FXE5_9PSEU|nr:3,4-dihydroxyphenylacetate 2,3-dioxygenase [Saccharopolyspora rosea]